MSESESAVISRSSASLERLPPESGTSQRTVFPGCSAASASAFCTEISLPRRSITSARRGITRPEKTLYEEKNHAAAAITGTSAATTHRTRVLQCFIFFTNSTERAYRG